MSSQSTLPSQLDAEKAKTLSAEEVFSWLGSSPEGLTTAEAGSRLKQFGPNELAETKVSPIVKFLSYFWGPIPAMIEAAMILSLIVGDWRDFAIIGTLLMVNAVIGFVEEFKADNAIEALKQRLALLAKVKRGGRLAELPATELVPGDIIHSRIGDVVPADCKILQCQNVSADQAALTGESLPVDKQEGDVLYSGSVMQRGEAAAVVTATGTKTFFGHTAQLVAETTVVSHYQQAVLKIGRFLISISLGLIAAIVAASLYHHRPFVSTLEFVLILAVAGIPVAMPAVLSVTMAVGAMTLSRAKAIVSRLVSIEEMAGMDVLCSDKTGTLTKNKLSLGETVLMGELDESQVLRDAALASKREDNEPIETAIFEKLGEEQESLDAFELVNYMPFDPVQKRTEATLKESGGNTFRVSKGAPQMIARLCEDSELAADVSEKVNRLAARGYRTLGVARTNGEGKWQFTGLLSLSDPPRDDSAATIKAARAMGVEVKMITGDHLAIAKETARQLDLGQNIYAASTAFADGKPFSDEQFERADGFAEVFPEHKYKIVESLQRSGHFVGMTGDGVNDAPALKKADAGVAVSGATDAGVAVSGATDAARGAADLVLTAPGLSVIITAIEESRKIFQRMNSYATYRIAETIDVLIFMTLSILIFQDYPLTAVMIILLALLNDLPIMMISVDNVPLSKKPVRWEMKNVMSIALLLGFISVGFSFVLYWFAYQWVLPAAEMAPWLVESIGPDRLASWKQILPPLLDYERWKMGSISPADNPISTLMFLKLAVAGHMTLYMARTGKSCFFARPWPAWKLLAVCEATQVGGLLLGVYGVFMPALGWHWGIFLIAFALIELLITDAIKVLVARTMSLEGGRKTQKHFQRVSRKVHAYSHP